MFVRVFSGRIDEKSVLVNTTQHIKERAVRVLHVHANEYRAVSHLEAGAIGILVGLKQTKTGDTLTAVSEHAVLKGMHVPQPVFFCTVEAANANEASVLDHALGCLVREDPTLAVQVDADTGQVSICREPR